MIYRPAAERARQSVSPMRFFFFSFPLLLLLFLRRCCWLVNGGTFERIPGGRCRRRREPFADLITESRGELLPQVRADRHTRSRSPVTHWSAGMNVAAGGDKKHICIFSHGKAPTDISPLSSSFACEPPRRIWETRWNLKAPRRIFILQRSSGQQRFNLCGFPLSGVSSPLFTASC